ncbi:MAG: tetratricopeptide repeat protein, partial [Kiritimatiellia bacterium]|nr:tetratricopeptide repeat protein [Kiritimatiellia bacterium]
EQGDAEAQAEAQLKLGLTYSLGHGVAQDYAQALKWYRKAAEQGLAGAQYFLGASYYRGQGVAQDYAQALKWYNLAAAQGVETGAKWRDKVADKMTPDQVAEAQRLAREWMKKHSK